MPFGITAGISGELIAAGIGETAADALAAGVVGAGGGALIGGIGAGLTGGNVGKGILYGGLGGALTGGIGGAFGGTGDAAADAANASAAAAQNTASATDVAGTAGDAASVTDPNSILNPANPINLGGGANTVASAAGDPANLPTSLNAITNPASVPSLSGTATGTNVGSAFGNAASGAGNATNTTGSGLGSWLGNPKSALQTALLANTGLSALQGILNPLPKENAAKNAAQVFATNPGFNASLPKYTMNNTATPYTGNWYTYGFSPQQVQYNAQPMPVMKHGGMVQHFAGGGQVMPAPGGAPMMPPQAPPMGGSPLGAAMPPQGMPQRPPQPGGVPSAGPLATQQGRMIGQALVQHLKSTGALNGVKTPHDAFKLGHSIGSKIAAAHTPTFAGDGKVIGPGGGQDDAVPAKLSQDEYVVPADVVAHLGDGSSNAGGQALDSMVKGVRVQKSGSGFPPKAKSPLAYIK